MFIRPEEILMELTRTYKTKTFGLADVIEWCMQVEIDHISDIDVMNKYIVETRVRKGRVTLPINIYRINYITDQYGEIIDRKAIGGLYIHGLDKYEGQIIKIEFTGVVMDDDCMPLIAASHKDACKRYIILQLFEDDALGDMHLFKMQQHRWEQFAGIVLLTKQGFREWTVDAIASLSTHRYNEPFKDVMSRIAERRGWINIKGKKVALTGEELKSIEENLSEMDVKDVMDQYVDIINDKIKSMPNTQSITFVLGQHGVFTNGVWVINLNDATDVGTFDSSAITVYEDGIKIIVPIAVTNNTIIVTLSGLYNLNSIYTIAVVPPTKK